VPLQAGDLQPRLTAAFGQLVSGNELEWQHSRQNQARFHLNFGSFLMDVRGFLLVK
jgi:hypothetical protein